MFKDTVNEDSSRIEKWKESRKVVGSKLYSKEIKYENKITEDGFSPRILSGGRLHRVSMGMTYSADEFNNLIALARQNGYSGWTLKQ